MIPIEIQTPDEIALGIAQRARALRVTRGWTQAELARRSGVALDTLRKFEQTGKVSLERLLMIAFVLDATLAFGELFAPPPVRTLKDLERMEGRGEPSGKARRVRRRRARG